MKHDHGLDTLLSMDGVKRIYPNKYWWMIKAYQIERSKERPHGIRYTFTLHDNHNRRIFGMDNKHVPPNRCKGYHGRIVEFDHTHEDAEDEGTAYAFINAETLMTDFLYRVKEIMDKVKGRK